MKSSAHDLSLLNQSIIYQVFIGRWESANVIDHKNQVFETLKSLPFENLREIGVDTIYFLGIFDNTGPIIVNQEQDQDISKLPNRVPSPFAISNHTNTNPSLGSLSELKSLIEYLHTKEFKVVVDFVANHTSTNHPWTQSHPEYYASSNQSFIAEFNQDVYKLDYTNKDLKKEMINILKEISSWGVDGVRCDMSHLVPMEFWEYSIKEIRDNHPNFIFIAEAYSDSIFDYSIVKEHIRVGFDAIYHQALYENLKKVYQDHQPQKFLSDHISFIKSQNQINRFLLSYVANHDDPLPKNLNNDFDQILEKITNLPGPTLIYNGTINGFHKRLGHHYIDILPDENNEVLNPKKIKKDNSKNVITLDIGASKIESAIVDEKFQPLSIEKQPTIKTNFQDFISQVVDIIKKRFQQESNIESISIALPGIVDSSGHIEFSGGSLPFLNNKNLKKELEKHFQTPIFIENDSNSFALGEAIMGAGKGYDTVFGITWGTGIGSGIVFHQKLFKGAGAAGEIGHIPITSSNQSIKCGCGKANCLEKYASGSAIQNQYQEMDGEIPNATVEDIVNSKEAIAVALIDQAVEYLAEVITAVINLINPEIVIIGGGLSHIKDDVFSKLEETINKYDIDSIHKTVIVKKELKNAALIGSAIIARQKHGN